MEFFQVLETRRIIFGKRSLYSLILKKYQNRPCAVNQMRHIKAAFVSVNFSSFFNFFYNSTKYFSSIQARLLNVAMAKPV